MNNENKGHEKASTIYLSRFKEWDSASWVRSGKHHTVSPFDPGLKFYSESLSPLFTSDAVRSAPREVQDALLTLHLYNYLEFTVWLELGPVNEVCEMIRRPSFLPWLPAAMKDDAFKIYVDEGGHAEMSHALKVATEEFTKVESLKLRPAFLLALDNMIHKEEDEFEWLIKLFFVIVSETLITGTLVKLPKDETVQVAVRELAADHATDEGRHHAYFRQVCEYVWPRLPREIKVRVGVLLPEMILAFLKPDTFALGNMLQKYPSTFKVPSQIVSETTSNDATLRGIAESAGPTLRMLKENAVFEDGEIREAFDHFGLVRH